MQVIKNQVAAAVSPFFFFILDHHCRSGLTSCSPVVVDKVKSRAELAHPYNNRKKKYMKKDAVPQPPCRVVNMKNNLSLSLANRFWPPLFRSKIYNMMWKMNKRQVWAFVKGKKMQTVSETERCSEQPARRQSKQNPQIDYQ
jgi:hypothetical protein